MRKCSNFCTEWRFVVSNFSSCQNFPKEMFKPLHRVEVCCINFFNVSEFSKEMLKTSAQSAGLLYQFFQHVWIFQKKMFKPLHRVEVCLSWSLESAAGIEQQHEVAIPGFSKSSLQESSSKVLKSMRIIIESFPLVVQTQSWRSQHLCRRPRSARPRWLSCRPTWRGGRWPDFPDQIR